MPPYLSVVVVPELLVLELVLWAFFVSSVWEEVVALLLLPLLSPLLLARR